MVGFLLCVCAVFAFVMFSCALWCLFMIVMCTVFDYCIVSVCVVLMFIVVALLFDVRFVL